MGEGTTEYAEDAEGDGRNAEKLKLLEEMLKRE